MRRVDQRPHKRESLAGVFETDQSPPRAAIHPPEHVVVYGAGIAGASTSRHLAELGVHVTVYDPAGIAGGASGIHTAVLHGRLLGDRSPTADLRCSAFHYASNYLRRFEGYAATGALQLQGPNLNARKLERICRAYGADEPHQQFWLQRLNAAQASKHSGIRCTEEALWFPTAGTTDLRTLCHALLEPSEHRAARCRDCSHRGAHTARLLCNGSAARGFTGCESLEMADGGYGQLDRFQHTSEAQAAIQVPRTPIVGNGYLCARPRRQLNPCSRWAPPTNTNPGRNHRPVHTTCS